MRTEMFRVLAILAALVGLGLLLASPSLTEAAGLGILARHGGSMDTTAYLAQMQAAGDSYRILGAILLGVGLFHTLRPSAPHRSGE